MLKENSLKFADYFTNKDSNSIGTLLAENFSLLDPKLKWLHGKKTMIESLEKTFKETQKVAYEVVNLYQDGSTTILEFNICLDNLSLQGVDFMEWEEGKMTELRCYYNPPDESPE